ncbi:hypothetical protein WSS_A40635 [Rhodococcus opacus M213]|uniref:DUF262 domain-containing protein n=1 Tax=Rhodococcus opacus M213 TaxID=1129896 RepID=K8X5P3_RHOOP|nr:DUF262 domain-containing protein [Rhodococcus opacus]EKT76864.1 hypothetical protein WSS_A40635 [Rhodococcus opacus M213]
MKGSIRRITELFDGNSKHLLIPVYQRNYDWKIKHCARLFDDLVDITRQDRETHFFGAIVGHPEDSFTYVVIDGQQRLTTSSLLMLALVHSLEDGSVSSKDANLATKIRDSYLVLKDKYEAVKFKLKPVKNDNDAYSRLLRGDTPIESSTITANYRYFRERIAGGELDGDDIWEAIFRLQVMALDLEKQDDPQRIFESINSTGLELSEADKIRNVVLMHQPSHEQEDLYENYWNRIEKAVEYRTDWFIRFYLVSKTGKTPRQDGVYEAFRDYQQNARASTRDILSEMRDYAEYSHELNSASTGIGSADKRLRRFNMVKHDVTLPLTMPLLGEVKAGTVSPEDFTEVVTILDSYLFRRFICGVPTQSLNRIFATLYPEIHRVRGEGDRFSDALTYSLRRRTTSGRFPTDDEFKESFATRNLYTIKGENRSYLFECLENNWSNDTHDIARALEGQSISIEHIMPQTLTSAWRQDLGADAEEIHATWCNRIGNLTVTGYNSSYSNSPFADKKKRDNGFDASPYRLNALLKSSDVWTVTQLEERTHALTAVALKYWPLPATDFEPYVPPLPSVPMGDDESFTNRTVVSFEYGDTRKTVASWKDAFVEVIRTLVDERRDEVFAYAGDPNELTVVEDSREISSRESLVVPGLSVLSATSTSAKLAVLRKLFDHLDIDTDDLVFTLRNNDSAQPEDTVDEPGPFAELTKFLPRMEELSSSAATEEDTRDLRYEFTHEFAGFTVANPQAALPGKNLPDLETEAFIEKATADDILAALSMMFQVEGMMPQFHRLIASGAVVRWLTVLTSNPLGVSDRHRVSTGSRDDTGTPTAAPAAVTLAPQWQTLFDATVSNAEKQLVIALAASELPVPTVGYETDDGEIVDFAWGDVRVGVLLDPDDDTANTMSEAGWTLCPPDAAQIAAAMKNGVV